MTRRVAVVTGGSAGVGRATVRALAAAGFDVAVLARGRAGVEAAVDDVKTAGGRGLAVLTDVSDSAQVELAAQRTEDELGPIDVWVNNAFVGALAYAWDLDEDKFRRITDVTYFGQVHGMSAALKRMRPRGHGSIVNVSSSLAHRGIPLQAAYCGAKHAIKGYSESVRSELAATGSAVTVSLVTLPGVNTPQFDWNLDLLGRGHPKPVPPIFQPEVAARAIVDTALRPRHDVWVGLPTVATVLGNRLAPAVVDWQLARGTNDAQVDDKDLPRYGDNLFQPRDEDADHGAHGSFSSEARTSDPVSWLGARVGRLAGRTVGVGLRVVDRILDRF